MYPHMPPHHRQTPVAPSEFCQPPATADRTSVSRKSHRQPLPTAPLWLCLCQVATPATASHRQSRRQPPATAPQPSATADRTSVSRKSHRQPPPTAPLSLASRTASHRRPHLCLCQVATPFAHRKCIQRWCNKKGDITCEICSQVFSPNYTLPPARSNPDVLAIDISQAWGPAIDLRDPRFLAFATAEHQLLQSEYDDYAIASSSSLACFRYVAIIMMLLLSVRQMLMVARDFQMLRESSSFFNFQISLLQLAGFLLPCYVMARSWYVVQCRRRRQGY